MASKAFYRLIIAVFLLCCGCARARHAVPADLSLKAQIPGMQDIRAFGGMPSSAVIKDFVNSLEQERKEDFSANAEGVKVYSMLAISGGAANGAYGAGLLKGWSQSGTRPVFKIVTGISTGAITAPLAFLGSKYDRELEEFYTSYSTKDVMRKRRFLHFLFSDSFATTWPLQRLIKQHFDKEMLKEVAREYSRGRRLYVGTTNLDAQRFVLWDMGKIAAIGDDRALELFQKIILASASVPTAFPPVYFDVVADGENYDEMHVDGGTSRQVFFLYDVFQGLRKAAKQKGVDESKLAYKIYIIRNGYADSVWKEVPDKLGAITERSIDTLVNAQGVGDLYRLYTFTEIDKGDFNLAFIPPSHIPQAKEMFDRAEMKRLFDLGFQEAAQGYPWKKAPPGLKEDQKGESGHVKK